VHQWARQREPATLKLLLDEAANVNATNENGETAMMRLAAHGNNNESMKLLVGAGGNVNAVDKRGRTVLHHLALIVVAMYLPHDSLAKDMSLTLEFLAQHCADSSVVDEDGNRAVDILLRLPCHLKNWLGPNLASFFGLHETY